MSKIEFLSGTKAETLDLLRREGFNVPKVYYFSCKEWHKNEQFILETILEQFLDCNIVVRSSTMAEDSDESSMAGAFESILDVPTKREDVKKAILSVIASYDDNMENHVLIQPMLRNVIMSGVIMTRVLDDGSPYFVINYDDKTGRTDTVTSGSGINKTVYVYNGVKEDDFDNPLLVLTLKLARELESFFNSLPLDIEFAIDNRNNAHLLQVRKITTSKSWDLSNAIGVSDNMDFLKNYVKDIMEPRQSLHGQKTLLGFMPDWNPAEMIGVVPRPLALSLYRELITRKTWRVARERMGYRSMPNVELMISLFGRPYIDVRNSFNSFLPKEVSFEVSEKLINAYLARLEKLPFLHDKIEFEVVFTALDFGFDEDFSNRYPDLLNDSEFVDFKTKLKDLTVNAITGDSLDSSLKSIELLSQKQERTQLTLTNSFALSDMISTLMDECINLGTMPFSILARHGFIAEGLLRSAVKKEVISIERLNLFRRSIITVSGEMSRDLNSVQNGSMTRSDYKRRYGHLRPSSYDILSPNYSNRDQIFDENFTEFNSNTEEKFQLTRNEVEGIEDLIERHFDSKFSAIDLFDYAEKAIKGREYAKFVFTKHLSDILELTAEWGSRMGLTREDLSYLRINDIINHSFSPFKNKLNEHYSSLINVGRVNFELASSFKLSYLIRSERDVHIVPMQRSLPNFIGQERIESEIVFLAPHTEDMPVMKDKIVCIEGADPGYDWIFTKSIAGLVTKFGGANSHMAIRCAEYGIPAAIGCGEQTFQRVISAKKCLIDAQGKRLEPLSFC